eukprot:6884125-Pyramimonas_sp.AAC.1
MGQTRLQHVHRQRGRRSPASGGWWSPTLFEKGTYRLCKLGGAIYVVQLVRCNISGAIYKVQVTSAQFEVVNSIARAIIPPTHSQL